jgi:hypothetical protein
MNETSRFVDARAYAKAKRHCAPNPRTADAANR